MKRREREWERSWCWWRLSVSCTPALPPGHCLSLVVSSNCEAVGSLFLSSSSSSSSWPSSLYNTVIMQLKSTPLPFSFFFFFFFSSDSLCLVASFVRTPAEQSSQIIESSHANSSLLLQQQKQLLLLKFTSQRATTTATSFYDDAMTIFSLVSFLSFSSSLMTF